MTDKNADGPGAEGERADSGPMRRDELIAGEYVLGILSLEDRGKVEARMAADRRFAATVRRWQTNLSGLDDAYQPVTPPAHLRRRIERRVFGAPAPQPSLWHSLVFWRGCAFASMAVIAVLGGMVALSERAPRPAQAPTLSAEMAVTGTGIDLIAAYQAASGRLMVRPVAARQEGARSLELWLVEGGQAPRSLGILPESGEGGLIVPADLRRALGPGATLAVSIEPPGGSPTGKVTGPVIAQGPVARMP
ncbi:anti-sigma factor domain-containing protein [Rhizobium rhizosphaerae]